MGGPFMIVKLISAEEQGENIFSVLEVTDEGGTTQRVAHLMPKDAAEWRVAEYDLDLEDHDTVIDVLLFEGLVHANGDVAEEDRLHNAPSRAHAREALLGAVRARKATSETRRAALPKAKGRAVKDPEPDARQQMAGLFRIHPEVVEAKREFVEHTRKRVKEERQQSARPAPPLAAERAANIRAIIERTNGNAADTDH